MYVFSVSQKCEKVNTESKFLSEFIHSGRKEKNFGLLNDQRTIKIKRLFNANFTKANQRW